MHRRSFLSGLAISLSACAPKIRKVATSPGLPPCGGLPELMPIRAQVDRIFRVTVCLRPFRAAGPRLDVERVGDKTSCTTMGMAAAAGRCHGDRAVSRSRKRWRPGERDVAVIGCGALGLTSAILLQRAGAKVTIYAKERPPEVRSARATGTWSPDSRVALTNSVSPDFPALWEKMCRNSFHTYESYWAWREIRWNGLIVTYCPI